MDSTARNYDEWIGHDAYDMEGQKLGEIKDIFYDEMTQRPEWLAVKTGLFGTKTTFVPIAGSTQGEQGLQVAFSKDHIKGAPSIDPEGSLTADEEQVLWDHYGYDYAASTKTTGYGYGKDTPNRADRGFNTGWREEWNRTGGNGRSGKGKMSDVIATETVHDQQAVVQDQPKQVRLRKYQWTEQVPVQREEVRVEEDANR